MNWIQFSIILLVLIIGFAKLWCSAYFTEDAKQRASKKHLKEVTDIIESLRTTLQFENTIRTSIFNERLKAIVEVYEATTVWIQTVENGFNSSLVVKERQQIKDAQDNAFHGFQTTVATQSKCELYVRDENLRVVLDTLRLRVLDLSRAYDEYYFWLAAHIEHLNLETQSYEKMHPGPEKNKMYDHVMTIIEERLPKFNEFLNSTVTQRGEVWEIRERFRDICFNLISSSSVTPGS